MTDKKVGYTMSQADYNALVEYVSKIQSILENTTVVPNHKFDKSDNVRGASVQYNTVCETPSQTVYCKEELNERKMMDLFGANYRGILYYNFDTNSWNTHNYRGCASIDADTMGRKAGYLKEFLENMSRFSDFELVAYVTMLNKSDSFPGWCEVLEKPVFSRLGESVLANIVCRSRKSGKILPVPSGWIGIRAFKNNADAVRFCYDATVVAITRSVLRDTLVDNFIKRR